MKKQNSYILTSVLVIMMVLSAIVYFATDNLMSELSIAQNQKSATICFHLADAGVQEAVWRLQHENSARNTFLNTTDGVTTFNHDPALLAGGSYEVTIQNTALATATINAVGHFSSGLKTARRQISVKVTKADTPPPYDNDGAIFTGGSVGEEDITLDLVNLNVTGSRMVDDDNDPETPEVEEPWGSLVSNRDIWYTLSTLNIAKDIIAKRNIRNVLSSVTVGGEIKENDPGTYSMPSLDITSDNIGSYKSLAIAQNQYYTAQQFSNMLENAGSLTLSGIVYVAGNGINIERGRSLTINGVLVSEGSIDIGSNTRQGTLIVNHSGNNPSGVVTLNKITAWSNSVIDIEGLVYVGDRFDIDPWYNLNPNSQAISIDGGLLCRRFNAHGLRTVNIHLNSDYINQTLLPNPDETPIIQTQHWEEEY